MCAQSHLNNIEKKEVIVNPNSHFLFHNQVDYCIGTGRMGLALQKEYMDQLKMVQDYIGFSHIRGHGLFCDDMAIYQEREENGKVIIEYNYTYLDMVMDSYLELGLRPFLELGFMPGKMASGDQTVFYWKGNVTPPKDYKLWTDMVQKLLCHLMERYGSKEVLTWPIEVWNEPNLPGFWKDASKEEYFKLFHKTFDAIKKVDDRFLVGGPAVCGGTDEVWIRAFLEYCSANNIPVDFVTRHHYTTDFPEDVGHYGYANLSDPEEGFANLHTTREIIDSFPEYKGLKIHITEFNTSYIPYCPVHDTNQNAAYIARQLSRLGNENESYSYWTFGDIFEERRVPFTPFHGGFGLVANGCIPKPTFWTFVFYKKLKQKEGECVYKDDNCVILKMENGQYRGVLWNDSQNRTGKEIQFSMQFETMQENYYLQIERVEEQNCNPYEVWHNMGEPANPSKEQVELLKRAAMPCVETKQYRNTKAQTTIDISVTEHGVVYFELSPIRLQSDAGFSYERATQQAE